MDAALPAGERGCFGKLSPKKPVPCSRKRLDCMDGQRRVVDIKTNGLAVLRSGKVSQTPVWSPRPLLHGERKGPVRFVDQKEPEPENSLHLLVDNTLQPIKSQDFLVLVHNSQIEHDQQGHSVVRESKHVRFFFNVS